MGEDVGSSGYVCVYVRMHMSCFSLVRLQFVLPERWHAREVSTFSLTLSFCYRS